jgi:hypothetical protein
VFVAADQSKHPISRRAAMRSMLCKTMLETDPDEKEIPFPEVKTSREMAAVVQFLEHDAPLVLPEKPMPPTKTFLDLVKDPWFDTFADRSIDELEQLLAASNYMDIQPLLELLSLKIAFMIGTTNTPQELRERLKVEKDFTAEEEEAIVNETAWAFETDKENSDSKS